MKVFYIFLAIGLFLPALVSSQSDDGDSDFAEFEEFEVEDDFVVNEKQSQQAVKNNNNEDEDDFAAVVQDDDDQQDGIVEDEQDEFDHFQDEEEFEGFHGNDDDDLPAPSSQQQQQQPKEEPKLTMAKVPLHFRTHWDSYYMEMIMLAGILAYFGNYVMGRGKNTKIVNNWLATHRSLLEDNFVLVGDDGKMDNATDGTVATSDVGFLKESESHYTLWCSGRTCCEGMLVELKLIKRQDLVSVLSGFMKPAHDQMLIKVELSKDIFDTFVFAVAVKKTASKLFKEQSDLNKFCTLVAKSDEKYKVPTGFAVLSEIPEASAAVLDSRLLAALHKYAALIEYIHISDQYSGPVPPAEDQSSSAEKLKQPEVKRMLMAAFNLPKGAETDSEEYETNSKALLTLVFYLMERVRRYRLSREGKAKAEKNRARVEEQFLKSTHAARAEAAAQRREDKRKAEKEKILAEEDPEKQRRMEARDQKREQKKKAPRMKKMSIKAM